MLEICEPVPYLPATPGRFTPGMLSAEAGHAAYEAICTAVRDARDGVVDAIATAPINKLAFARAGLPWKGHTDLLAHLTGSARVAMMFWSEPLKVILATVHVPLAEVPRVLTRALLDDIIDLAASEVPVLAAATYTASGAGAAAAPASVVTAVDASRRPGAIRLAMSGLNPHAGEHGVLGVEEQRTIAPAVRAARQRGVDIQGPFPADTVFVRATRGEFDAVIACYHDQGLIPVKLLAFGHAVNVTLGLPIVRTSVDHGTAFDIAGSDAADPTSMIEATVLAARLAAARRT